MNNRFKHVIVAIICLFILGINIPVFGDESPITILVNNVPIKSEALIINGTTYLPVRAVSEALGAQVRWDGEARRVFVDSKSNDQLIPEVIKKISPSVVGIIGNVKNQNYSAATSSDDNLAHGTGVIIKSNGEILTNAHVVKDLETIIVVLSNGEGYEATLKCIDIETDLALVQINKTGLPVAEFGSNDDIISGKTVIAIGTPISFSLRNSATLGIISGINRSIGSSYRLIQTDAAINPGNSGGPLVDIEGKILGINSNKYSGVGVEGMGFSIPVDTINYVLKHFDLYGEVKRPYIGIKFVEDWAARVGLPTTNGLTVTYVYNESPAETVLKVNDEILSIDGVTVTSIVDLNELMKNYLEGDLIIIKIKRERIIQYVELVLGIE